MSDLLHAPIEPRDWSVALWAYSTTPGGRSAILVVIISYATLLFVPLSLLFSISGPISAPAYTAGGVFAGMVVAVLMFQLFPMAAAPLPLLAKRIARYRKELDRRRNLVKRIVRVLLFVGGYLLSFVVLRRFLGSLSAPVQSFSFSIERFLDLAGHPVAPSVGFVLSGLITWTLIVMRRAYIRSHRDAYLLRMDEELARILARLRSEDAPSEGTPYRSVEIPGSLPPSVGVEAGAEPDPKA